MNKEMEDLVNAAGIGFWGQSIIIFNPDELPEVAIERLINLVEHATIERIKHPLRTEHNRYSDIVSDGGMDPRDRPFDPPKVDIVVQAANLED
jgi:hypothetical protein